MKELSGDLGPPPQQEEPNRVRRSDSYRVSQALILVLAIKIFDITDWLGKGAFEGGSPLRYAILVLPFIPTLLRGATQPSRLLRRPRASDKILLVFMAFGLAGSMYGRLFLGTQTSALPVFLPMVVGVSYLLSVQTLTRGEARQLLHQIASLGLIYVVLHALAATAVLPFINNTCPPCTYRHPGAFLDALAVAAAVVLRQKMRLVALAALLAYVFIQYPAATYLAVALTGALIFFLTQSRATSVRLMMVGLGVFIAGIVVLSNLTGSISFANDYFTSVGKENATTTRLALWEDGLQAVRQSPILGSGFAGEMTVPIELSGIRKRIPLHNDYLQIAFGGGFIGVGLFIAWIVVTDVAIVRRHRILTLTAHADQARLVRALLVAFNAWMCIALFNALLQEVGLSAPLFAIYALMMMASTIESTPTGSHQPNSETAGPATR